MGTSNTTIRSRRAVLAALGTTLVAGTAAGADDTAAESSHGSGAVGDRDVDISDHRARARQSRASSRVRVPATTVDNGIVVQFRDCSRVRIFGNPLAADLVSVFVGYYGSNGIWADGVVDVEADFPMTIDANEAIGDDAASQVVIGGVDVFEETESGPAQLVTAQPPDGWSCLEQPEQP